MKSKKTKVAKIGKFAAITGASLIFSSLVLDAKALSQKEIEVKLKILAETPAPKDLQRGAMCYSRAFAPAAPYMCPVCNKTSEFGKGNYFMYNILAIRKIVKEMKDKRKGKPE